MKKILLFFLLVIPAFMAVAQVSIKDSSIFTPIIHATYEYQFPSGDLAERFGSNSSIGGGLLFKTRSNWLIGAEFNYLFGSNVRNSDSLLLNISTTEGLIIDANGMFADVIFYMRGYNFFGTLGKLFPVLSPNPNSGISLSAGLGYAQNKIRIHNPNNTAPQIFGDYNKGYDKLNGGFALKGSLGYQYLSNSRLVNFYAGFEFMQAWTKSKRDVDFETGEPDLKDYSSQYYSIRVMWFIPIYKRVPKAYYLY